MNADTLIAEAAQHAGKIDSCGSDFDARMRLARNVGRLEGIVRRLCADLEHAKSSAGIAESIAAWRQFLPADWTAILTALRDKADQFDDGQSAGFDDLYEAIDEARGIVNDPERCYWYSPEERAEHRREYEADQYADETRDARSSEYWERRA